MHLLNAHARISLTATVLGLALLPAASFAQNEPVIGKNLFQNGDMLRAISHDNTWDGVDFRGRLRVNTGSKLLATRTGTLGQVALGCSPALYDLDKDGLQDLVVADPEGYFWVYPNSGSPQAPKFTRGEILPIWLFNFEKWPFQGDRPQIAPRIAVTDFDGNGQPDILVGTVFGELFHVPLTASAGKLRVASSRSPEVNIRLRSGKSERYWGNLFAPAVVDWNRDFKDDLILGEGTYSANAIWLLLNEGGNNNPKFDASKRRPLVLGEGRQQLVPGIVDWDGDNNLDVLVIDQLGEIRVYLNKDGDTQARKPLTPPDPPLVVTAGAKTTFGQGTTLSIADVNNDKLFDLVLGLRSGHIQFALNIGKRGSPAFELTEELRGEDLLPRTKRPSLWNADDAFYKDVAMQRVARPYAMLEQVKDPPGDLVVEGRANTECLLFHTVKPERSVVEGSFPNPYQDGVFQSSIDYGSAVDMKDGARYRLSFWHRGSGFTKLSWSIRVVNREQLVEGTRRDERALRNASVNVVAGATFSTGGEWKELTETVELVLDPPGVTKPCVFMILLEGDGEFYLDEVELVPEA